MGQVGVHAVSGRSYLEPVYSCLPFESTAERMCACSCLYWTVAEVVSYVCQPGIKMELNLAARRAAAHAQKV